MRVRVRLAPGARQERAGGVATDENSVAWLTASVTAPPEDGRANKALVRLLSKQWRIAKSSITLIAGQTSRKKTLLVAGRPDETLGRLTDWLARIAPE